VTPRKALAGILDAIGQRAAHFAGWLFCRSLSLAPPEEPADQEAVNRIVAACYAFQPTPEQCHAALIVAGTSRAVYLVPPNSRITPHLAHIGFTQPPHYLQQEQRRPS
jgi:hypothetical protein